VIESEIKGKWHISINIADVSFLIQEDSPLDIQARERATSFYSPTGECLAPMFPPEISELAASLGTDEKRAVLSLQFTYTVEGEQISEFNWVEGVVSRTRSFTYDEANTLLHNYRELQIIKDISKGADSHEWVQNLMILYNKKAGEALKMSGKGILRAHSVPKAEKLSELVAIDPSFAILAYDAATFCLSTAENTRHFGLNSDAYAYASSPIRRYCDLVNQRALKGAVAQLTDELVISLNRRQKQAKAFSRDLFFMIELANKKDSVKGVVISHSDEKSVKIYVPVWKRCIKVRIQSDVRIPLLSEKVSVQWYDDREKPNWKERIVFRID
jgi:exoribonuclease R